MNHVVLFDGTQHRPWGKYLGGNQEVQKAAPQVRQPDPLSNCGRVLECLQSKPMSRGEIERVSGLLGAQVKGALAELMRQNLVRSETRETRQRCFGGVTVSVRYHAVGKWEQ